MDQIQSIGPIGSGNPLDKIAKAQSNPKDVPSFKDTMSTFMKDVNSMQVKADESINRMAAGEITDVHQVMNVVEEANVAFNMMMEIRNKVMEAYQQIIQMRL
jgi:flagellar hook-basal body complex protein FliE